MRARAPLVVAKLSVTRLLFLLVGVLGCILLLASEILPYDDLVQQECAPKTWCNGSGGGKLEQAHIRVHEWTVFILPGAHNHAPSAAAGEVLSRETSHASTVVIASDYGRGPPLALTSAGSSSNFPSHS